MLAVVVVVVVVGAYGAASLVACCGGAQNDMVGPVEDEACPNFCESNQLILI